MMLPEAQSLPNFPCIYAPVPSLRMLQPAPLAYSDNSVSQCTEGAGAWFCLFFVPPCCCWNTLHPQECQVEACKYTKESIGTVTVAELCIRDTSYFFPHTSFQVAPHSLSQHDCLNISLPLPFNSGLRRFFPLHIHGSRVYFQLRKEMLKI